MYEYGDWRAQTIIVAANPNAASDDPEENVAGIPDRDVERVLRQIEALDRPGPLAGRTGP